MVVICWRAGFEFEFAGEVQLEAREEKWQRTELCCKSQTKKHGKIKTKFKLNKNNNKKK
jgi:hypothetical protein